MHNYVNLEYLKEVTAENPNAKIIAHPESKPEVLEIADYVTSTSGMIDVAKADPSNEFFVLTECGMIERLGREVPCKKFKGLCNMCFDMKKNTLPCVFRCLEEERHVVRVDRKIGRLALNAFEAMFDVA